MIRVVNDFRQYNTNAVISTQNSNSVGFDNCGDVTVYINNIWRIKPGEFKSLSQLIPDVIDGTRYNVSFAPLDPFSTGTDQNLVVITSIYADNPNQKMRSNDANIGPACS
jgi:hypothetical protein